MPGASLLCRRVALLALVVASCVFKATAAADVGTKAEDGLVNQIATVMDEASAQSQHFISSE